MNNTQVFLLMIGGVCCVCAAIFNWNWFFINSKAHFFVRIFGRTGARIFYALLGLFLMYGALKFSV
ncbi:MAG: immunity 17 family protein [Neisseriaceae bacterium]|nr:immunity 17 family protein [Neisseriaceae bacterium]MBO7554682.1 immunity 17 family protein [Neisseriaceae bacterium]MBP5789146.1 immunity 17 family protein [Neisseriaceae bacterium]MBQ1837024.1 immunity 17 family protein [Neisseriaceae bacterium]MBQ5428814.1 immunity 17 family protein [Neisseriaceae bacterium]